MQREEERPFPNERRETRGEESVMEHSAQQTTHGTPTLSRRTFVAAAAATGVAAAGLASCTPKETSYE